MKTNQAAFAVRAMCRVLGLSPSGYYAWLDREPSARAKRDEELTERIEAVWSEKRRVYGRPQIYADLKEAGERVGEKRVGRLMKQAGIQGVSRRRRGMKTTQRNEDARPAPDLVERNFSADGPDQLWVADITYVPTWAGFLYLAVVVDAWSRRVVGWSMATHLRTELVLYALDMALLQRRPEDVIHHSDQGTQGEFKRSSQHLRKRGGVAMAASKRRRSDRALRPPMGSPGRPPLGRREHRQRFWEEVARGLSSEESAVAAGVSPAVGARWFRQCGGMPPFSLRPLSGALPIVRRARRDCGSSSPRLWRT